MRRASYLRPLVLALSLIIPTTKARGQTDIVVMKGIYSNFLTTLQVADRTQVRQRSFVVLANPGIVVDPWLDPNDSDDRKTLSRQLDAVPLPSWLFRDSGAAVSTIYQQVLSSAVLPTVALNAAQRQQLDNAKEVLFVGGDPATMSVKHTEYLRYKERYEEAVRNLENARDPSGQAPLPLVRAKQRAEADWRRRGFKAEVEAALSVYNSLTNINPPVWWEAFRRQFVANQIADAAGNPFPATTASPSYEMWPSDAGWLHVTLSSSDLAQQPISPLTNVGGATDGWRLWRWSEGPGHSDRDTFAPSAVTNLNIEMDLKRVSIQRPWFNPDVFRSKAWRWNPLSPGPLISAGRQVNDGTAPAGVIPLLPTSILIARDIKLHGDWPREELARFRSQARKRMSVGWGPFSLSGAYFQDSSFGYFHATPVREGFRIPGIQIVAWLCEVTPKSPDPDPDFNWPQ